LAVHTEKIIDQVSVLIDAALKYSGHRLKTKNLISILTSGNRFAYDTGFKQLALVYDVSVDEIVDFMRSRLENIYNPHEEKSRMVNVLCV
jgi:hypothetical protein